MSPPATPGLRAGLSREQLTALVAAVRQGDLSPAQSELLARLVLESAPQSWYDPGSRTGAPRAGDAWPVAGGLVAEAFGALVAEISPSAT